MSDCLRVDCNEAGFTEENVKSICRAGRSTKVSKGYIGEKGLGFKSAFKVAEIVRISSGPYSFYFDRNTELGIITPIIAPFPEAHLLPKYTQFLLEIPNEAKQQELEKALDTLPTTVLIFLRRLRQLKVVFKDGSHRHMFCQFDVLRGIRTLVTERAWPSGSSSRSSIDHVVVRHTVNNLPKETKRKGIVESEVVLAFPISKEGEPLGTTQATHAYLPISDYGLKVVCHLVQVLQLTVSLSS